MYAKYLLRLVVMMALATTGMIGIEGFSYYHDKQVCFFIWIKIAINIILLGVVRSNQIEPARNIRCDRTCMTKCETTFDSTFTVLKDPNDGNYKGLTIAPDRKCYEHYNEELTKRPDFKDNESCKKRLENAETLQVVISIPSIDQLYWYLSKINFNDELISIDVS